jgi:hypothetical protein
VGIRCWVWVRCEGCEVEDIVEEDEEGDYKRLGDLDAVDTGEDVYRVRAEDGKGGHVGIVQPSFRLVSRCRICAILFRTDQC